MEENNFSKARVESVDTPAFRELFSKYQLAPTSQAAGRYIGKVFRHIDAHTARAVEQERYRVQGECEDRIGNLIAELKDAQPFQQRVQPWIMACFGAKISADAKERNHRFFEESTELVQAHGMTASEAHQLVDYVYGRPVGEPAQEVGGVMVTLAALCLANDLDMDAAAETELARIWTKVEAIRAKQANKPRHSPLPQSLSPDSGCAAAQFQAGVREGYERAAKALGERAAGWRQHGDHHLEEEVLQCRSMLHDQKPVAPAKAGAA